MKTLNLKEMMAHFDGHEDYFHHFERTGVTREAIADALWDGLKEGQTVVSLRHREGGIYAEQQDGGTWIAHVWDLSQETSWQYSTDLLWQGREVIKWDTRYCTREELETFIKDTKKLCHYQEVRLNRGRKIVLSHSCGTRIVAEMTMQPGEWKVSINEVRSSVNNNWRECKFSEFPGVDYSARCRAENDLRRYQNKQEQVRKASKKKRAKKVRRKKAIV